MATMVSKVTVKIMHSKIVVMRSLHEERGGEHIMA